MSGDSEDRERVQLMHRVAGNSQVEVAIMDLGLSASIVFALEHDVLEEREITALLADALAHGYDQIGDTDGVLLDVAMVVMGYTPDPNPKAKSVMALAADQDLKVLYKLVWAVGRAEKVAVSLVAAAIKAAVTAPDRDNLEQRMAVIALTQGG